MGFRHVGIITAAIHECQGSIAFIPLSLSFFFGINGVRRRMRRYEDERKGGYPQPGRASRRTMCRRSSATVANGRFSLVNHYLPASISACDRSVRHSSDDTCTVSVFLADITSCQNRKPVCAGQRVLRVVRKSATVDSSVIVDGI